MKYGRITFGEVEALINRLGGEKVVRGILDRTVRVTVMTQWVREFLYPMGEVVVPASTGRCDPWVYFRNLPGLYVSDSFKCILGQAHPTSGFPKVTLSAFDLVKFAKDAEIRSELPEGHVFEDPSKFTAILARMINRQPNGAKGNLLTNGCWNIFYVRVSGEVCTVSIFWDADDREWSVFANPLDYGRSDEGNRVFSCNC